MICINAILLKFINSHSFLNSNKKKKKCKSIKFRLKRHQIFKQKMFFIPKRLIYVKLKLFFFFLECKEIIELEKKISE